MENKISKDNQMNPMKEIRVDKVTINFGAGSNQALLEKGIKLVKMITGKEPVKTTSKKRIPTWGIRPGLPIGCKQTLRGKEANGMIKNLLEGVDNRLNNKSIDTQGNFSFGIKEYVDVPSLKYDPDIGILGFDVTVTLMRQGYRVMKRKKYAHKISKHHKISKEDAMGFIEKEFKVNFGEEE